MGWHGAADGVSQDGGGAILWFILTTMWEIPPFAFPEASVQSQDSQSFPRDTLEGSAAPPTARVSLFGAR
jgi:hypothetical protein